MKNIEIKLLALVHGELAAEDTKALLALIESDPAVKAQYEELLEAHVMMQAASAPEESWQMEEGKRGALLKRLRGEEDEDVKPSVTLPKPTTRVAIPWQSVSAVAACLVGTVVVGTLLMPKHMSPFAVLSNKSAERFHGEPGLIASAESLDKYSGEKEPAEGKDDASSFFTSNTKPVPQKARKNESFARPSDKNGDPFSSPFSNDEADFDESMAGGEGGDNLFGGGGDDKADGDDLFGGKGLAMNGKKQQFQIVPMTPATPTDFESSRRANEKFSAPKQKSKSTGTRIPSRPSSAELPVITSDSPSSLAVPMPEELLEKVKVLNAVKKTPASPSSSVPSLIASAKPSDFAVPMPDVSVDSPSSEFGETDGFGDGFGDGTGTGFARDGKLAANKPMKAGDKRGRPYGTEIPTFDAGNESFRFMGSNSDLGNSNDIHDRIAERLEKRKRAVNEDSLASRGQRLGEPKHRSENNKPLVSRQIANKHKSGPDNPELDRESELWAFKTKNEEEVLRPLITGGVDFAVEKPLPLLGRLFSEKDDKDGDDGRAKYADEDDKGRYAWWAEGEGKKAELEGLGLSSRGQLTDVKQGGLRRDLSISFEEIAKREKLRRGDAVKNVDALILEAGESYKDKDYKSSVAAFNRALGQLPSGRIFDERRAYLNQSLVQSSIAMSKTLTRDGDITTAKETLENVLKIDPTNTKAEAELDKLDDPIRTSPSATKEHSAKIDQVRRNLYKGEGFYNLGQFDKANEHFDKVLRTDPYNQAARRWQTKVHNEKSDYFRSAFDETRARLLTEVDKAWEIVPRPAPEVAHKNDIDKIMQLQDSLSKLETNVGGLSDVEATVVNELLTHAKEKQAVAHKTKALEQQREVLKVIDTKKSEEKRKLEEKAKNGETHQVKNLNDEATAQSEPFSTFSLHVSDVSFKLAKSALLEQGVYPDKNKIRPEEFVNAFDYGDPSVKGDAKVACHMEQAIHPFMQQRNLMRVSMSTAALGRSQPLRLTLLLDNSGSMERADREASVIKAIEVLVSQLQPEDEVSLISFSLNPRIIAEGLKGAQLKHLVRLVKQAPSEGGTNMEKALQLAGAVAKRNKKEGTMSRIVLLTDGAANLGNADPEDLSESVVALRQQGIAFDACGVGADKLDDNMLETLARKGDGRYYLLDKAEDADSGFVKQLAGALRPAASNVKVQVKFNPKRVKHYKLLGFEKHLLKKEDFRNDQVDAAEMAAQEAGSAMYQFEPMANGSGDVGEVFVRFRDMTSGQMVERSWAIPYQPQPLAVVAAKPSMQLASTAAMLAEKVRGSDVGLVDFSDWGEVLGSLGDNYANDARVQDLIQMVRKVARD